MEMLSLKKSFLIKVIIKYLKRVQRYTNQNLGQTSVLVTASTGKAATGFSGIKLHSAFLIPITLGLKSYKYKKPSDETLDMLQSKYQY